MADWRGQLRTRLLQDIGAPAKPNRAGLSKMGMGVSVSLDILRFAVMMFLIYWHLANRSEGLPRFEGVLNWRLGFFFVLSGFMIQHIVSTKEGTLRSYSIARASRLYSVAVPAILLTILLDPIGRALDVSTYRIVEGNYTFLPLRFVLAVSFLSQIHGHDLTFMSNAPGWALGYEAPYYGLFAILCFAGGKLRILLCALWLIICGGNILWLLPIWYSGVLLYEALYREGKERYRILLLVVSTAYLALYFVKLNWLFYARSLLVATIPAANILFQGRSVSWYLIAAGAAVTIQVTLLIAHKEDVFAPLLKPFRDRSRWLAGATFSLYLFHFPIMYVLVSIPGYDSRNHLHHVLVLGTEVAACILLAQVTERRRDIWANWFERAWDFAAKHRSQMLDRLRTPDAARFPRPESS